MVDIVLNGRRQTLHLRKGVIVQDPDRMCPVSGPGPRRSPPVDIGLYLRDAQGGEMPLRLEGWKTVFENGQEAVVGWVDTTAGGKMILGLYSHSTDQFQINHAIFNTGRPWVMIAAFFGLIGSLLMILSLVLSTLDGHMGEMFSALPWVLGCFLVAYLTNRRSRAKLREADEIRRSVMQALGAA